MATFFHAGFKSFHDAGSDHGSSPEVAAFASSCASLRALHLLQAANKSFAFVLFGVVSVCLLLCFRCPLISLILAVAD